MQDFSTSLAVVLNVFLGVFISLFLENILPFPFLFKILFLSLHLGITDGMSLTGNITISFRSTRVTQTFSMQFLGFKNRTDYTAATSSMPPSIWPICPQEPTCVARLSSKKSSSDSKKVPNFSVKPLPRREIKTTTSWNAFKISGTGCFDIIGFFL